MKIRVIREHRELVPGKVYDVPNDRAVALINDGDAVAVVDSSGDIVTATVGPVEIAVSRRGRKRK